MPASSRRKAVITATTSQFCRWNAVRRLRGTGCGYGLSAIAPIVVVLGASATDFRAASLSVFIRQSWPPQRAGDGAWAVRADAATAAVAAARHNTAISTGRFTFWAREIYAL